MMRREDWKPSPSRAGLRQRATLLVEVMITAFEFGSPIAPLRLAGRSRAAVKGRTVEIIRCAGSVFAAES